MPVPGRGGQVRMIGSAAVYLMTVDVGHRHTQVHSAVGRSGSVGDCVVARQLVHGEQAQRDGHDPQQQPQPLSGADGSPDPTHVFTVPTVDRNTTGGYRRSRHTPHENQRRGGSYAQASRCVRRDLAVSSPVWSNSSGTVVPQPVLELEQVLGVSAAFASGTRVGTPGSLGRVSVNLLRAGPSLRDRQDNRRAARPLLLATLAGCQAGSCDPADRCCSVAAAKS